MTPEIISLGELLIDFVSMDKDVSLVESGGFGKKPGGAPANVVAGTVKLGIPSGFIGKVGEDPFGYYLKQVLDQSSIDTTHLVFDKDTRTTLSFVANRGDQTRDCMFYRNPGADMLLMPEEISEDYIKSAKVFHFGSISLGSKESKAATLKALEYAKKHNLLISYDPNYREDLWRDKEQAKAEMNLGFEHAHVVKVSEEEYQFITGTNSFEECADYILDKGAQLVVITLGEKGCYYSDGENSRYLEGYKVNVVETTGAGDAFVAGMLSHLVKMVDKEAGHKFTVNKQMEEILAFANAAGALATTKIGAIPSMPAVEDVNKLIGNN
jgi:fructokinase